MIKYIVQDKIATITLNRADKLNTVSDQMIQELIIAINVADSDDAVRAIIVTGSGSMFCAGADLSAGEKTFDYEAQSDATSVDDPVDEDGRINYAHPAVRDGAGLLTLRIFDCRKPVIGAIHGAAIGVGMTMTLAMDARFAAEDTKFGMVFTRRGIVPEGASTWFLPRLVGMAVALDWGLSGRIFLASEALKEGLVNAVVPKDELMTAARAYAQEIVSNTAPVSVALTRQMLWRMAGAHHPMEAHRLDSRGVYARGRSADAKEGVMSFLEKRSPDFPDKISSDMPDFFPWWIEETYK